MTTCTGRLLIVVTIVLVAASGCSESGPTPEEIMTSNDEVRAENRRLVDEASELLLTALPDVELEEITGGVPESWSSCTDEPFGENNPPESVTWSYERGFRAQPDVGAAAQVSAVAALFLERGWNERLGSNTDRLRIDRFANAEGYMLSLTGHRPDDELPAFYVTVDSPCVPAPPDLYDR